MARSSDRDRRQEVDREQRSKADRRRETEIEGISSRSKADRTRILPLKRATEEKARAIRAAASSSFKSMLREKADITTSSRWSKVKDSLRNDPRYKSIKHEDREILFNEYIAELKSAEVEVERAAKAKQEEQEKLKERERVLRKRKEREEQEVERVRSKARRKEAVVESYQALLVETIKDPQASWTESKPKLEKDPQGRAANPYLDQSDLEKLFREHVKVLHERCVYDFRVLLSDAITPEVAAEETEDGKTATTSWSTAKRLLKSDPRYTKMPRKERESLWHQHVEEMQQRQKLVVAGLKPYYIEWNRDLNFNASSYDFRVLLSDAITPEVAAQETEDGKTAMTSWSTAKRLLKSDPRYTKMPRKERESLWHRHVEEMQQRQKLVVAGLKPYYIEWNRDLNFNASSYDFRVLLSDAITPEVAAQETEDGKTAMTSWSTAKRLLKSDPRYTKMPRKERESLWHRHVEEMQQRQKLVVAGLKPYYIEWNRDLNFNASSYNHY